MPQLNATHITMGTFAEASAALSLLCVLAAEMMAHQSTAVEAEKLYLVFRVRATCCCCCCVASAASFSVLFSGHT